MKIKVVYDYDSKIKILKADSKFKKILTAWDENCMSLWQELVNELHQIVKNEVGRSNRYVVYEADSNRLMYF